jgi:hypothetical protein
MIDYDNIDDWAPQLSDVLNAIVPDKTRQQLSIAAPRYVEDSLDQLFNLVKREAVIDATLGWINSKKIAAYHGSRLTDSEIASVRESGLIPLKAEARRERITRALSSHPNWHSLEPKLGEILQSYGQGNRAGRREDQVHLTLSRASLVNDFDHYLQYGAEFDQHVAQSLVGSEGMRLLACDGHGVVIQLAVPGSNALNAAHPHFSIEAVRARGDTPNVVREFLKAWCGRLTDPSFQTSALKEDCGMVFYSDVPATWIVEISKHAT